MTFLRRFEDPPSRFTDLDAAEADSIVRNLTHILRSQSGFASFVPEFGLPDPWQLPQTSTSLLILRDQIKEQVLRFESRLGSPLVATVPRTPEGALQFVLTGQLASGKSLRILICMSRSPSGGSLLDVRMQG
ncbi:MAG TPA: GPW/gp25 family protein [Pseudomonadota bacterium]|jgi:predicted component of type VI protein secretion system|nr:GPW/gp25 family protein [Pseudomonadota bacterium]HNF98446.1 GPW/gp25 family protein [Pseudomonadota bacterium]HNN52334.1 GPW/gp25 family protein [Pseudomonadota bacterium]